MYASSAPATSQAKLEAKKNGKIRGTTIMTTPNNIDVPEGRYCKQELIGQACRFDESMYDWTIAEIEDCIDKKSDNNFLYIEFSYKELGRSEEWFRQNCKDLQNNMLKIKREILLEWTRATDNSVYSEEQLDSIYNNLKPIVARLCLIKYYFINIYKEDIDFRKPYVISGDVSTGQELDASTITVIDPYTYEIVADFRENKIPTDDYKKLIYELAGKFFINSMIVIENNAVSNSIISWLMNSAVGKRMYYEYREKTTERIEASMKTLSHVKTKKKVQVFGMLTTKATRPLMFEILDRVIDENPEALAVLNVYSDIKTLERHKGKIEHAYGEHDDSLMAYLIGLYTIEFGKNLAKFLMPVSGKTPESRKNNIIRTTVELSKANSREYNKYNGMAEDIIEQEKIRNLKNSGKSMSFFTKITTMNELDNLDSRGRVARDIFM